MPTRPTPWGQCQGKMFLRSRACSIEGSSSEVQRQDLVRLVSWSPGQAALAVLQRSAERGISMGIEM